MRKIDPDEENPDLVAVRARFPAGKISPSKRMRPVGSRAREEDRARARTCGCGRAPQPCAPAGRPVERRWVCEGGEGGLGARRSATGQSVSGAWSVRLGGRGLTHPGAGSEHGRRMPVLDSQEARDRHIPANPSSVCLSVGALVMHPTRQRA